MLLKLGHAARLLDELKHESVFLDERVVENEAVADAELGPSLQVGARHPRESSGEVAVNAIRHRLEVALAEGTLFALLRKKDQEGVAVVLVDGDEVVPPGLHPAHVQDQIGEDVPHLLVDARAVVVLYLSEVRRVDVEHRETAIGDEHVADLVRALAIAWGGGVARGIGGKPLNASGSTRSAVSKTLPSSTVDASSRSSASSEISLEASFVSSMAQSAPLSNAQVLRKTSKARALEVLEGEPPS